jgi:hypothetical protein
VNRAGTSVSLRHIHELPAARWGGLLVGIAARSCLYGRGSDRMRCQSVHPRSTPEVFHRYAAQMSGRWKMSETRTLHDFKPHPRPGDLALHSRYCSEIRRVSGNGRAPPRILTGPHRRNST